ncbi:hypothetical protein ACLOJK_021627 [Asimina triloba]
MVLATTDCRKATSLQSIGESAARLILRIFAEYVPQAVAWLTIEFDLTHGTSVSFDDDISIYLYNTSLPLSDLDLWNKEVGSTLVLQKQQKPGKDLLFLIFLSSQSFSVALAMDSTGEARSVICVEVDDDKEVVDQSEVMAQVEEATLGGCLIWSSIRFCATAHM